MQKRLVAYVFAGLLVMSLMTVFVPSAEAQASAAPTRVQVTLNDFGDAIRPLSGSQTTRGTVEYLYHTSGNTALANTQVDLRVTSSPPWAVVTISPSSLFFALDATPGGQMASAGTSQFTVFVSTTADAPAFQPGEIAVTATALPNDPLEGSSGSAQVPVEADYFSIVDTQITQPIRVVRPQTTVDFPITVTNFGNAQTRVTMDIKERGNLVAPTPQPVTLQAEQQGGEQIQGTIPLSMETPFQNGYMNRADVLDADLKAVYALDTTVEGDTVPVAVMVTTKGFYVPGASGLLIVGALAMMALVMPVAGRRRS